MSKKNQTQNTTEKTAIQSAMEKVANDIVVLAEVTEPINVNAAEGQELATMFDEETVQAIINNRPYANAEELLKAIPKLTPHIDGLVDKQLISFAPIPEEPDNETPKPPTREERLADFMSTNAKLITVDFAQLRELVAKAAEAIEVGDVAEHPDVASARLEIVNLNNKLNELGMLPNDIRKYAEIGIRAQIAEFQATIELHAIDDPVRAYMLEHIFFALHEAGTLKFGIVSKRKTGKRSASVAFDSKSLIAFSYQTKRTLKDGTSLEVPLTKGYLVGHEHSKVTEANLVVPPGYLGIFSESGILMGKVNASESKGSILGTAVVVIAGGDESKVKAISGTGIAALEQESNASNKALLASIPELKASLLSNGRNSELASQTVGTRD